MTKIVIPTLICSVLSTMYLFLVIVVLSTPVSASPHKHLIDVTQATIRGLGTVEVSAEIKDGHCAFTITNEKREVLFKESSLLESGFTTRVAVGVISDREIPIPIIIFLVYGLAADRIWLDPTFIGYSGDKFQRILPEGLVDRGEEAVCFGRLGPDKPVGAAIWKVLEGRHEAAIGSHRYRVMVYRWSRNGTFTLTGQQESSQMYDGFEAAARELGFQCSDVLSKLISKK